MKTVSPTKSVRKPARFNPFFPEMIIVLFFFSAAAAVILRSFAFSDRLARESRRMESMAFCAQSAAELYSETGSLACTAERLFDISVTGQLLHIDPSEGNAAMMTVPLTAGCEYSPKSSELTMTMTESCEYCSGGILKALNISFSDKNGEVLYEITAGAYIHGGRTVSGDER